MAMFDPRFAHDVTLRLAEAAYLPNPQPGSDLPTGYTVVGQIVIDQTQAASVRAIASPQHSMLVQKMLDEDMGFGWVLQNLQEHVVAVCFRGTISLEDWLHDIDFMPAPYQPVTNFGTVHQGFQVAYSVLRNSMFSLLSRADSGYTRMLLIGHSLGAAISELAAPDLLHNGALKTMPEVHNYAGPRAGHHDFASLFDVQIDVCFRVVNLWDIVPDLPPALALFEHVGQAVKVDGGFTLNELQAHSMVQSYDPGLLKLIPRAGFRIMANSAAAPGFPNEMLVGREP